MTVPYERNAGLENNLRNAKNNVVVVLVYSGGNWFILTLLTFPKKLQW